MNNRKKVLTILLLVGVALLAILCVAALMSNHADNRPTVIGGGGIKPVAYDNALHPAPGTQLFDIVIKDNKLAKGPSTIHSVIGGAIKLNVTAYTKASEYEFFIEQHTNTAEIDYTPDNQKDVLVGQVYTLTNTKGTFKYGFEDESTGKKITLGTLYVQ
jgi:hypothetical protein